MHEKGPLCLLLLQVGLALQEAMPSIIGNKRENPICIQLSTLDIYDIKYVLKEIDSIMRAEGTH